MKLYDKLTFPEDINVWDPDPKENLPQNNGMDLNEPTTLNPINISGIFTPEECKDIIKLGKSYKVNESQVGGLIAMGQSVPGYRSSYNSWIMYNPETKELFEKIKEVITNANEEYYKFDLNILENLQYTEYPYYKEGRYRAHIDITEDQAYYNQIRKLSFSVQLTDPNLYEGGDLQFHMGNMGGPVAASRELGSINIFPSFWLHEVTEVTKGNRCSLVGWVHGPMFK